jgi:hypothetical protein
LRIVRNCRVDIAIDQDRICLGEALFQKEFKRMKYRKDGVFPARIALLFLEELKADPQRVDRVVVDGAHRLTV